MNRKFKITFISLLADENSIFGSFTEESEPITTSNVIHTTPPELEHIEVSTQRVISTLLK